MKTMISVIVPVHNRELLDNLVKSLVNQSYQNNKYEIIFVGSKKNSMKELFSTNKSIRYFEVESQWPDAKINFGIKKANGKIIAITSDDCIPNKDWLEKINQGFGENREIAAITGKTTKDKGRIFDHAVEHLKGILGPASNMAFKKNKLIEIGGYDENFHFYREETLLHFKLLRNNEKILFKPNVIVYHPLRESNILGIFKELEYIRTEILLSKQYPLLFKKYLGFPVRGLLKQSLFTWAVTLTAIISVLSSDVVLFGLIIFSYIIFRYFVNFRKYEFNIADFLIYGLLSFIRDLLAPFYFISFFISLSSTKLKQ